MLKEENEDEMRKQIMAERKRAKIMDAERRKMEPVDEAQIIEDMFEIALHQDSKMMSTQLSTNAAFGVKLLHILIKY